MANALMPSTRLLTSALKRAFEAHRLDATKDDHWFALAMILAEKEFGKPLKKIGRPNTWDDLEYQVALDAVEIENANEGKPYTARKLAQTIYERFPEHYEQRPATQEPWHEIYVRILAMKKRYEGK